MYIPKDYTYEPNKYKLNELDFINKWILSRLNVAIKNVNDCFDNYDFGDAV